MGNLHQYSRELYQIFSIDIVGNLIILAFSVSISLFVSLTKIHLIPYQKVTDISIIKIIF